jgi:hypothetical protein
MITPGANTLFAAAVAVAVFVSSVGGAYVKGRSDGAMVATARTSVKIETQRADIARKNDTIVKGDQELIAAKTQDKEKIQIVYRTIREQQDVQVIENTVYRDRACVYPASSLRLIAAAAAGDMPADPKIPAGGSAGGATSPKN